MASDSITSPASIPPPDPLPVAQSADHPVEAPAVHADPIPTPILSAEDSAPPMFVDDTGAPLPSAPLIQPLPDGSKKARLAAKKAAPITAEKREKPGRKRNYTLVAAVSGLRSLVVVFAVGVIVATIFTSFTSNDSLSAAALSSLAIAQVTEAHSASVPTDLPTPVWLKRIGIVPGHSGIATRGPTKGNVDPGATCADGFTEASVTMKVATQVIANLRGRGYTVDQLDEWDTRLDKLNPYDAALFLSIHADSCVNFDDGFPHSGFKVANPEARVTVRDEDLRMVDCLRNYYGQSTGLPYSGYAITANMTDYHAFHEITQRTPAAIIELGLLYYDRDLLEHHPDKAADGITEGLLCFLDPKSLATSVPAAPLGVATTLPPGVPSGVPPIAPSPTPIRSVPTPTRATS